jgi:hypothetical protein
MKRKLPNVLICFAIVMSIFISKDANSQTTGTLSFTVNPVSHTGNWGTDHFVAIWIENSSTAFVKTKLKNADNHGTSSHLLIWKAKSTSNVVDATTGASLTAYTSPLSIIWNGTDISGTVVPDGTYNVWVEFTWNHGATGVGTTTTSLQFTKGPAIDIQSLATTAFFSGISLTWTPDGVGIQNTENKESISVYPNPSTGIVNIDFKQGFNGLIQIENTLGAKIYEEQVEVLNSETKTIDLSKFANGTYYVNVQSKNSTEIQKFKVVLNK